MRKATGLVRPGGSPKNHQPRQWLDHLPGQLHADRGDEPLPMRLCWRRRAPVHLLGLRRRTLPEAVVRPADRPDRHPCGRAARELRQTLLRATGRAIQRGARARHRRARAPGRALQGHAPADQRRHGAGRSASPLPARWRGPAADAGGHAPAAPVGAGLPSRAEAGAHDRRPGWRRGHWAGAPGRGDPVPAEAGGVSGRASSHSGDGSENNGDALYCRYREMTSCGAAMMAVDIRANDLRIVGHDNDTVLDLRPIQGLWTEEQYLTMTDHSRRLLEFDDGYIEVLPMPTDKHQAISQFIFLAFL